jgi:hypothetical protein
LPGGERIHTGEYDSINDEAYIGTSTPIGASFYIRLLESNTANIETQFVQKMYGISIRCVRDL